MRNAEAVPVGRGSEGQQFLIGETLYLRGLEQADAQRATAWRGSLFPITTERAEELLKKNIPEQARTRRETRLVACRIIDDVPVGFVLYQSWDWRTVDVSLGAHIGLGPAAAAVKAEILCIVVPWLLLEREKMVVWVDVDADEAPVVAAAEAIGMHPAARLREAFWRDGARRDHLIYEVLHPSWVEQLGDPRAADSEPERRDDASRTPRAARAVADPPGKAIMVGERVYLRPVEIDDAEKVGLWSRQERETFFDDGRAAQSGLGFAHLTRKLAEDDPPSWIRFAIVLRDGDEYIGSNGLDGIDWVHRTAETESFIDRAEHRGGGLGTEAKHLLLEYAFERLGLHMVRSFVFAPNTRSASALRKQGYRDAGRLRWAAFKDGKLADFFLFDLLAEEWRAARRTAEGG